jgi:hypothetical protein
MPSIKLRISEFVCVRQETEALVRVYQKLVATNANVMAGQAAGNGQGTVITSAGIVPGVCEVSHRKHQLLVARVYALKYALPDQRFSSAATIHIQEE